MPTDEFTPDLSSLSGDYQILTALRTAGGSQTYLARHLKLNRDVTITIVRVPGADNKSLSSFASDARTLAVMRHRNVVPVIEGRWLSDGSFAIVRARVRGSTLDQVLGSSGPMPMPRVASTLEQVYAAVEWARANGIVHRHVSGDAIVYQQGSGRLLLELDPSPLGGGAAPDACADARTIGRLAYEMLSGQRDSDPGAQPLAHARPDLPAQVVSETEALMQCESRGEPRDAAALIALLGGRAQPPVITPPKPRTAPPLVVPTGPLDSAVVVVKRPYGFNARIASAVVVLAIVAGLGFVLLNRRGDRIDRTAMQTTQTSEAAGEVALAPRSDTSSAPTPAYMLPAPPTTPQHAPAAAIVPTPATVDSTTMSPPVMSPPVTRRSEPPRPMTPRLIAEPAKIEPRDSVRPDSVRPDSVRPDSVRPDSVRPDSIRPDSVRVVTTPRDTAVVKPSVVVDACDSIEPLAQARCLDSSIERSDQSVNSAYQQLIAVLRREASLQPTDPDPPSVDTLRESQRKWRESRDAACRDVGVGLLFARARAQCYADQASRRRDELRAMIP